MSYPTVTIGIPSYNKPKGLAIAISSILDQTFSNYEIIIADDCSPNPEVREVIESFSLRDSRIKYFLHKKNMGPKFNFKFLLENAKGEYFMWLADDDYRHPDCLKSLVEIIRDFGTAFSNFDLCINNFENKKKMSVDSFGALAIGKTGIRSFFKNPTPNIMYGLHNTAKLKSIYPTKLFDFWDFFIAIKMIDLYGCAFESKKSLIMLGIDEHYKLKPYNGKIFNPLIYLQKISYIMFKYFDFFMFRKLAGFFAWVIFLNYLLIFRNGRLK